MKKSWVGKRDWYGKRVYMGMETLPSMSLDSAVTHLLLCIE